MATLNFDEKFQLELLPAHDGIIEFVMSGSITADEHGNEIREWVERFRAELIEEKRKNNGVLGSLGIANGVKYFDEEAVRMLTDLAATPELEEIKTAVVIDGALVKMALRTIVALSHRKNIKQFNNREEAIAWLKESDAP